MKIQTILFVCCIVWMAVGFANNCAKFNPDNFRVCAACVQRYYLTNGKCVLCTQANSTVAECLPKFSSSDKPQSTTNSTITTPIASIKTEQIAASNLSLTDSSKNSTIDSNTTKQTEDIINTTETTTKPKIGDSATNIPKIELNLIASNSTLQRTNVATNTSQNAAQINVYSKPTEIQAANITRPTPLVQQTQPLSLLQFLTRSGLANCAQFAITSEGVVCSSCKQNFGLNSDKLCVPLSLLESNISSTNQKTTVGAIITVVPNSTQNINKTINDKTINDAKDVKTVETLNSSTVSDKINNIDSIAETGKNVVNKLIQLSNKGSDSQSPVTSTFIPPILTSTSSINNPTTGQNTANPTLSLFYSLPASNKLIANADNSATPSTTTTSTQNNININLQASTQPTLRQQPVKFPTPNRPTDPNCLQTNPAYSLNQPISLQNRRCLRCYASNYYNIDLQICTQINPLCRTADDQNNCLSCYPGYELSRGDCVIGGQQSLSNILVTNRSPFSTPQPATFSDANCNRLIPNTNQCILCAVNYFLSNGLCRQVNPLCRTYNRDNGNCLSCYQGYTLNTIAQPTSCSINPITDCRTYDRNTGSCLSCYTGYYLSDGSCKLYSLSQDPFCTRAGAKGCEQCIQRYYPDENGTCQMVSLLCARYNQSNGVCQECILLYTLVNGQCVYQHNQ